MKTNGVKGVRTASIVAELGAPVKDLTVLKHMQTLTCKQNQY
ncbi:MAG: hypothetical protein QXF41_00735 [Candidatus Micrarchaeaceae archaeon]